MASRTESGECLLASRGVTWCAARIGGRSLSGEGVGEAPFLLHAFSKNRNLTISQHAACGLAEGRHCGAGNAVRSDTLDICGSCDREIYGVRQRNCRAVLSIYSMAGCAILGIESGEVGQLFRARYFWLRPWLSWGRLAPCGHKRGSAGKDPKSERARIHCGLSSSSVGMA